MTKKGLRNRKFLRIWENLENVVYSLTATSSALKGQANTQVQNDRFVKMGREKKKVPKWEGLRRKSLQNYNFYDY
jgi:hypothetical protein